MNGQIDVSICCLAYNHEKFIRRCLDGFLMQKGVTFEILIHEDASTDSTANIIREYESKYPSIFRPVYQQENQYSKEPHVLLRYVFPLIKGKYVALCEGDDFWTDPYKLKKQFDVMEANPGVNLCLHKVQAIHEDESRIDYFYPHMEIVPGVIPQQKAMDIVLHCGYQFHTSSFFMRNSELQKAVENPPEFISRYKVGDTPVMLYFSHSGDLFFIDELMSLRRFCRGTSWCESMKDSKKRIEYMETSLSGLKAFDEYTGHRYHLEGKIAAREEDCFSIKEQHKAAFHIAWINRRLLGNGKLLHLWSMAYCPFLYKSFEWLKTKLHK